LRSPLTAVYGLIETLQTSAKDDPEARARFLKVMEKESRRMMRLVDDLLSLSKYQAKERQQPEGHLDIVPLLESVVSTLKPVIARESMKVSVTSTLLNTRVHGDAEELRQVFQNLIENSIKYGQSGTEVKVYTCTSENSPGMLCVCVEDQGEGIDPADIPRLTERFYRIDKGRSRAKGGTGLGLAIVKHILIRHRGILKIDSEPGKGSTFSVYLPRVGRR
jgi:two-component system phosphate regulon sensor histidine kinase PhoR